MTINIQQIVFALIVFGIVSTIAHVLVRRDRDQTSRLCLEDLLLDADGKMSRAACVLMGSFVATTAILIYQAWKGTLTDMTYGAYLAAWVAPVVTQMIVNGKPANANS